MKGGNIPKEFIPSVQKGFTTAMKNGVLAGYPLDSLKVTLVDGSFTQLTLTSCLSKSVLSKHIRMLVPRQVLY